MSKNTKKTSSACDNPAFLCSVSNETKDHFDRLLKKALHKNDKSKNDVDNQNRNIKKLQKPKSTEKETINLNEDDDYIDLKESPEKGNFILEKFLSDAVNSKKKESISPSSQKKESISPSLQKTPEPRKLLNSITFIKPPVPLPRTAKNENRTYKPLSREKTYSISSPVLQNTYLIKDIERLSTSSKNTYDVDDPKVVTKQKDEDNHSNTSRGTYNIYKPDQKKLNSKTNSIPSVDRSPEIPIGDIIIHNSSKSRSLVKIVNSNKKQDSNETQTSTVLHESEKQTENLEKDKNSFDEQIEKDKKSEKYKNNLEDEIIERDITSDEIASGSCELKDLHVKKDKHKKERIGSDNNDNTETLFKNPLFTYEDLIGVVVYKTDKLLLNSLINHPCVKIHIVDSETGEYLTRSKELQGESNSSQKIKHIYPLITKAYKLQQNRSLIPYWEELIVFNEDFNFMLEYKDSVIIFFEILDFLSFTDASLNYSREGSNSGWHKVAWAFLKLVSKTGQLNTEQKIRLQLYKPKRSSIKKSSSECVLYDWWAKGSLTKYPSTLHVSIKRVNASSLKGTNHSDAIFKSEFALNVVEKDNDTTEEIQEEEMALKESFQNIKWSRMPNQSCKIPNNLKVKFKSGKKGCFALKFSNNGLLLACGIAEEEKYAILIYSVINKHEEFCKFSGHQGLIYHLFWSSDDKYLISSSADCTVYIWNVFKKQYYPKQVLPHPAFVYCSQLNEEFLHIITGCYDQVIRIWKSSTIESSYELLQELDGHNGYITSLCFGENKSIMYSSDSVGLIIEWNLNPKEWFMKRTLKCKEFQKTVINNIILHPGANRLLVFCRDSTHRMIDLTVGCIMQWYRGALNYRVHTNGCLSPCGNLVFAPSEDGLIYVWNTDTGILLATYNPYSKLYKNIIIPHCIHYHPLDHIIAISHYGAPIPILFFTFDSYPSNELQLKKSTKFTDKHVKEPKKESKAKVRKGNKSSRSENACFEVIIDKIDDVLVSAKSN